MGFTRSKIIIIIQILELKNKWMKGNTTNKSDQSK